MSGTSPARLAPSPLQRLAKEPARFSLDQAVAVTAPPTETIQLRSADGMPPINALALRYRTQARLGYPAGEVVAARPEQRELTLGSFGLIGAGGVLPRHHTAVVGAELRQRSPALHAFLDMLSSRFAGLFVMAGAKYRPTRNPVPAERALAAVIGMGTPHLADRLGPVPLNTLLYHAGNLAARTRPAARLQAMLEDETGWPVSIEEFQGDWLRLPPDEQTRLGGGGRGPVAEGQHAGLGRTAVLGAETWDTQGRFVIRFGPLDRAGFESVLPGTPRHARISALARLFTGLETSFVLNPVLAAAATPDLALGRGARLGWSSWLASPRPRQHDSQEARFQAF